MLRTVGSSLLAKASSGGAFRKVDEQNIDSPALPGKGELGTVNRSMMEQPIERQVPAGSAKVVSAAPAVEASAVAPSGMLPTQPIDQMGAPGVGLPASTPNRGVAAPNAPQSPNVGLMQPTLRSGVSSGVKAKTASGGEVLGAGVASAYQPQSSAPVNFQGNPGQNNDNLSIQGPFSSKVGGKAFADTPGQKVVTSTAGQTVAGPVSSVLRGLSLGQGPIGQVANTLRSYAYSPQAAQAGVGSAGNAIKSAANAVVNNVKSGGAIGQAAQKVSGWLRSLFK